ncbi:hypothetical protein CEXT_153211 [Caerostris extrusa]|uniref:Uncharacterized protein n=1 Tax=Caerostris extrusa TaxID=172846 RepID=A0AAV4RCG5_CAEEX|nr:hypothetical protein CEXT_153211 [Caerostris extrusa]
MLCYCGIQFWKWSKDLVSYREEDSEGDGCLGSFGGWRGCINTILNVRPDGRVVLFLVHARERGVCYCGSQFWKWSKDLLSYREEDREGDGRLEFFGGWRG